MESWTTISSDDGQAWMDRLITTLLDIESQGTLYKIKNVLKIKKSKQCILSLIMEENEI
jgi:hypothetical protein